MITALLCIGGGMVLLAVITLIWMWTVARNALRKYHTLLPIMHSVSIHTYHPRNAVVPYRGLLVLEAGVEIASSSHRPLILAAGLTVPHESTTEAQFYGREIYRFVGAHDRPTVIFGKNPMVRETYGEIQETISLLSEIHSSHHIVVALAPHIPRIQILWKKALAGRTDLKVAFLPVAGPKRFWLWEMAMLWIHFIAPPGSRLQGYLLDATGRGAK